MRKDARLCSSVRSGPGGRCRGPCTALMVDGPAQRPRVSPAESGCGVRFLRLLWHQRWAALNDRNVLSQFWSQSPRPRQAGRVPSTASREALPASPSSQGPASQPMAAPTLLIPDLPPPPPQKDAVPAVSDPCGYPRTIPESLTSSGLQRPFVLRRSLPQVPGTQRGHVFGAIRCSN